MQIIFKATTQTSVAYGAAITTGNCQVLPSWAPPIQYIGSTTPWNAVLLGATTMSTTTGGFRCAARGTSKHIAVRNYGRRSTLHGGAEVVALRRQVHGGAAGQNRMIMVTYRAIGEIVRP